MTVTLTATARPGRPPGVDLLVTATAPTDVNGAVAVVRIHADGTRHRVITEYDPHLMSGVWAVTDSHPPYNQVLTYEVTVGPDTATSVAVVMSSVTWLIPPSDVESAVSVQKVAEIADRSFAATTGRFPTLGGKTISVSGEAPRMTGSVTLRAEVSGLDALLRLLQEGTILISTPAEPGWEVKWLWVSRTGHRVANPGKLVSFPFRLVTLEFEECEDPDVDLTPMWTDADMGAAFASDAAAEAAYASAFDAELDRRL